MPNDSVGRGKKIGLTGGLAFRAGVFYCEQILKRYAANGLAAAGVDRVAIFGNRAVMDTDAFGSVPRPMVVKPDRAVADRVHEAYDDIALHGKRGTRPEADFVAQTVHSLFDDAGAQAILLAGTDLSSFYADEAPSFRRLDVAQRHIDEIIRRAMDR